MTLSRPRLVLLPGEAPIDASLIEPLREAFEIIQLEDAGQLQQFLADASGAEAASVVLQHIGEGVAVVDAQGKVTWQNNRLNEYDQEVRRQFAELCHEALQLFNAYADPASRARRASRKFSFRCGESHFEMVASPGSAEEDRFTTVVGVLWDVTASRRLLDKLEAIDAAGSELMKIEAEAISHLSMAERLTLLEEKIVTYVHDLLEFDDFEIRMLDRETNRLDLVMAIGISPLRIGEVIFAEAEGNGISGYVAASGESYLCPSVRDDPRYREGLDNAASSLTVPLRLHDRTIGVFNIESQTTNAFDENDRQFATIFGRYIAMAMNILNLLVVERFTTNEQVARTVLGELSEPLADITGLAETLREEKLADGKTRKGLDEIIEAVEKIRRRIAACSAGPRTVLGAEEELHRAEPDPAMIGKRVLVADDDDEIRNSVAAILTQRGCQVIACAGGGETIDVIRSTPSDRPFALIISDIKMPDRSGYEVFRAAKEAFTETPVILMTGFGYDPHHSIVRASQEGLQSFLFKPFKARQLVEEVKKAFELSDAKKKEL
ncbi:MAG: response regulator [Phycisphaerales bacterium]